MRKLHFLHIAPLLALSACATPVVTATPNSCASLLPNWSVGVAPPELPADDTVGSWIAFVDAAVGKLDIANSRTRDAIEIVSKCEARDAASVKQATRRKMFGLF